jgi:hypothetical protein
MSVFQRMFFEAATSHSAGSGKPSATPTASWPRNAGQLVSLARTVGEPCVLADSAPAASGVLRAAGFDTALRAVLKTSPGPVLSEGSSVKPESKPEGRTIRGLREESGLAAFSPEAEATRRTDSSRTDAMRDRQ